MYIRYSTDALPDAVNLVGGEHLIKCGDKPNCLYHLQTKWNYGVGVP